MSDLNTPFLSIIIPTKNRQFTCLYAIESALQIPYDDTEIIVQDCSDTNILQEQIIAKFGTEKRIKYYYVDTQPSMTENWNEAYSRASGTYMCGIGDDDGILAHIYDIAKWGEANELLCITHSNAFTYNWPDFASANLKAAAIAHGSNKNDKRIIRYNEEQFNKFCSLENPLGYSNFPMLYHNLTHRKLYDAIVSDYGQFLGATSVDVYTVFCYHQYLKNKSYGFADFQFSIRGGSGASNSSRFNNGKIAEHFSEYKNNSWPHEYLPYVQNLHTTVAESMINACIITGQQELINKINFPLLYANCVLTEPSVEQQIIAKYILTEEDKSLFYTYLNSLTSKNFKKKLTDIITHLPIPKGIKLKLFEYQTSQKVYTGISTITACISLINTKMAQSTELSK